MKTIRRVLSFFVFLTTSFVLIALVSFAMIKGIPILYDAFNPVATSKNLPDASNTQIVSDTIEPTPTTAQVVQQPNTIDCIGPDGKHLQITQKQCDDFNNAWRPTVTPAPFSQFPQTQSQSQSQPVVTCVLSYGTYQVYQSDCNWMKSQDTGTNTTIPTYIPVVQNPLPTAPPATNNNAYLYQQCISNAQNTFNQAQQYCMAQWGTASSAGPACVQIAQQQEQQSENQCATLYPH